MWPWFNRLWECKLQHIAKSSKIAKIAKNLFSDLSYCELQSLHMSSLDVFQPFLPYLHHSLPSLTHHMPFWEDIQPHQSAHESINCHIWQNHWKLSKSWTSLFEFVNWWACNPLIYVLLANPAHLRPVSSIDDSCFPLICEYERLLPLSLYPTSHLRWAISS